MNRRLAPIALAAPLLAMSCGGTGDPAASTRGAPAAAPAIRKIPVTVQEVAPRALIYSIDAVGQLAARELVRIPARVSGIIEGVSFEPGSVVKRGTLLARIDAERYRLAAAREEARVAESRAALVLAEAQLDRRRALAAKNAEWVSADEMAGFSARVDQARASLAAAEAAHDLARKDLRDSDVRAEGPGVIEERLVGTGEHVEAGRALATIVDVSRLRLTFGISESEAARLGDAPRITFRVKSMADRDYTATLAHVGGAADPATRKVECLAWVDTTGPELKPGYFCEVRLEFGGNASALVVPPTSVLPTERGLVAFVVEDGVARERFVSIGLQSADGHVEILDGLRSGEIVVVRGAAALRDGALVQIESPANAPPVGTSERR